MSISVQSENGDYTVIIEPQPAHQIAINRAGVQGSQGIKGDTGTKGDKGDDGEQGIQGVKGDTGAPGQDGAPGADGADGDSAYEIAVANGFVGTETAWLASLVGPAGADGTDGTNGQDGAPGQDGADGLAATIAVGTVTTLPAGSAATVTNVGTSSAAVFDMAIPQGAAGAGSGDMLAATYDPTAKASDAFAMDNMAEGTNAKVMTAAERTAVAANTAARHSHSNKTVLDNTEQSFTTGLKTKLDGIASGADVTTSAKMAGEVNSLSASGLPVDNDAFFMARSTTALKVYWQTVRDWLRARANHTGTQAISTVAGLQTALDGKFASPIGGASQILLGDGSVSNLVPVAALGLTYNNTAEITGTVTGSHWVYLTDGTNYGLKQLQNLPVVTTGVAGLMSAADKVKLNAVGTMANRAATISASNPSGGANGDVWFKV